MALFEGTLRNVSWLDKLSFSASVWLVAAFSSLSPCLIFLLSVKAAEQLNWNAFGGRSIFSA